MNDITFTFGLFSTLVLFFISVVNFINNKKKDLQNDTEINTKISVQLDNISKTTSETRSDIKSMKSDIRTIQDQQIKDGMRIDALWDDVDRLKKVN